MQRPSPITARYFILLLLVIVVVIVALMLSRTERQASLRQLPPARIEATTLQRMDLEPVVEVSGRLHPQRSALLHFEISGQVKARQVEPGQAVAAEEVLLSLHEGDFADSLALAEAQWQQEQAAIERDRSLLKLALKNSQLQAREVARLNKLGSASLASKSLLGEARQRLLQLQSEEARLRYAVETAEARLALREAERSRARRNLQRTQLRAPFAGTVNRVAVQVGDYVSPSQMVLELIDSARLELHLEISSETAAVLSLGQRLDVQVEDGHREGQVVALQQDPDPSTYTHALRIRLSGEGLLPGRLARATLSLGREPDALVVPVNAVLQEDGAAYLFVIEDGNLVRQRIELGRRAGPWYELRAGVAEDTLIAARDVAALADGQRVQLKDTAQAEPAAAAGVRE